MWSLSSSEAEHWHRRVPNTSRSTSQLRSLGLERDGEAHPPCTRGSMANFVKRVEGVSGRHTNSESEAPGQALDCKAVRCSQYQCCDFRGSLVNHLPGSYVPGFMYVVWWVKT